MRTMKFKILDQWWRARKVPAHDPCLYVDGTPRTGSTWPVHQHIFISDELNDDFAKRIIRHELTHAFIAATQADAPEHWTEEMVCDFVGIYNDALHTLTREIYESLFLVDLDVTRLGGKCPDA